MPPPPWMGVGAGPLHLLTDFEQEGTHIHKDSQWRQLGLCWASPWAPSQFDSDKLGLNLYESSAVAHSWHPESAAPRWGVGASCQSRDQVQEVTDTIQKLDRKRWQRLGREGKWRRWEISYCVNSLCGTASHTSLCLPLAHCAAPAWSPSSWARISPRCFHRGSRFLLSFTCSLAHRSCVLWIIWRWAERQFCNFVFSQICRLIFALHLILSFCIRTDNRTVPQKRLQWIQNALILNQLRVHVGVMSGHLSATEKPIRTAGIFLFTSPWSYRSNYELLCISNLI